ncbi:hypothetical protein [Streptomyces deserti]
MTTILAPLLLTVLAFPALLGLWALRRRSAQRFALMRQWAAFDRGHEAECPTRYGTQRHSHGRFVYASAVLALALILTVAILTDQPDRGALALLPCLVVAGLFAWSTVRKYAGRYGWATREHAIRCRARRREQYRVRFTAQEASTGAVPVTSPSGFHLALLCSPLVAPAVIVTLAFVVVRPKEPLGLGLAGLLSLAVLVVGLPVVVRRRLRERAELSSAGRTLASAIAPGVGINPVHYGLREPDGQVGAPAADWDAAPSRVGALTVESGKLRLRGVDGSALDLPLADVHSAVLVPGGVAWLAPSVDVLPRSGEGIEVRSPHAQAIADALAHHLIPVVSPTRSHV